MKKILVFSTVLALLGSGLQAAEHKKEEHKHSQEQKKEHKHHKGHPRSQFFKDLSEVVAKAENGLKKRELSPKQFNNVLAMLHDAKEDGLINKKAKIYKVRGLVHALKKGSDEKPATKEAMDKFAREFDKSMGKLKTAMTEQLRQVEESMEKLRKTAQETMDKLVEEKDPALMGFTKILQSIITKTTHKEAQQPAQREMSLEVLEAIE